VLWILTILLFTGLLSSYLYSLGLGQEIRHMLENQKHIAWALYVFFMMLAVLSPLPDAIVTTAGGYVFPPVVAYGLSFVGIVAATSLNFYLARFLGKPFIFRHFPHVKSFFDKYGIFISFETVLLFKIAPSLSVDILSYAAGLSKIPYSKFALAICLGVLPSLTMGILLGEGLEHGKSYVTIPLIIGIYLFCGIVAYQIRKNRRKKRAAHALEKQKIHETEPQDI